MAKQERDMLQPFTLTVFQTCPIMECPLCKEKTYSNDGDLATARPIKVHFHVFDSSKECGTPVDDDSTW